MDPDRSRECRFGSSSGENSERSALQGRRRVLSTLAGVGSLLVAGCLGQDDPDGRSGTPDADVVDDEDRATGTEPTSENVLEEPTGDPEEPAAIRSSWPMPRYDHGRTNATDETAGPDGPVAPLWEEPLGDSLSMPVVDDGTTVVGTGGGSVIALTTSDGSAEWTHSVGGPVDAIHRRPDWIVVERSTGITVFTADGEHRWSADVEGFRRLAVGNDRVFVLSRQDGSTQLIARDIADGSGQWTSDLSVRGQEELVVGIDRVFVIAGDTERIFEVDSEAGTIRDDWIPGDHPGGMVVSERGLLHGDIRGSVTGPGWVGRPDAYGLGRLTVDDERVYVAAREGESPGLYAYDLDDGNRSWHVDSVGAGSTLVATSQHLFAVIEESPWTDHRGFACLDPATGDPRWVQPLGEDHRVTKLGSQFAVVDDLIVTTVDGTVTAFRPP